MQEYFTFLGHYTITELIISRVQIGNKIQACVGGKGRNPYVYLDLFCWNCFYLLPKLLIFSKDKKTVYSALVFTEILHVSDMGRASPFTFLDYQK